MTRYRLGDVVTEWVEDELWVGALPDGPIGRLDGVGMLVLEALADGEARGVEEIVAILRREVEGMPEDAGQVVAGFLRDLEENGVVHRDSRGPGDQPRAMT